MSRDNLWPMPPVAVRETQRLGNPFDAEKLVARLQPHNLSVVLVRGEFQLGSSEPNSDTQNASINQSINNSSRETLLMRIYEFMRPPKATNRCRSHALWPFDSCQLIRSMPMPANLAVPLFPAWTASPLCEPHFLIFQRFTPTPPALWGFSRIPIRQTGIPRCVAHAISICHPIADRRPRSRESVDRQLSRSRYPGVAMPCIVALVHPRIQGTSLSPLGPRSPATCGIAGYEYKVRNTQLNVTSHTWWPASLLLSRPSATFGHCNPTWSATSRIRTWLC